jgi:UDP-N-acetylglucosamine--N-acetylmuramyl-(pentapeptide) pyrophosphoryl-undecaprenol N-acetylglucosamine transferase
MATRTQPILFAGGGTVGHLAPGFALAEALQARGQIVRFATPGEAHERDWFAPRDAPLTIPAARLPRGVRTGLRFGPKLLQGVSSALAHLRRERIRGVVALGGWPCVPAALAASIAKRPLAFISVDAVPGLVVRRLAGLAGRVYVTDERAVSALAPHPGIVPCGPLLRAGLRAGDGDPAWFGLRPDRRTLLITGGSLGARGLSERFLLGLEAACAADSGLASRIQILHAVGRQGEGVAARYDALGLVHHVTPFLQDMGRAYAVADLLLARAGANTCLEIPHVGLPAVLVPYPHHADRQQFHNAEPLVAGGGARLLEEDALDAAHVRSGVLMLLEDEPALATMRAALETDSTDSLGQTADDLIRFMEGAPAADRCRSTARSST